MSNSRNALLLCLLAVPAVADANGSLSFVADPGYPTLDGQTFLEDFTDDEVITESTPSALYLGKVNGTAWSLYLSTAGNHELVPACYERTRDQDYPGMFRPRFEFRFPAVYCQERISRYDLLEFVPDSSAGTIASLAVDFVQHCVGSPSAVFGKLRFNSSVPLDTSPLLPVFAATGVLHFNSDQGDYVGGGVERTMPFDRLQFLAERNFYDGLSMRYWKDMNFSESWNLDLAAPDSLPLSVGYYPDAERFPFQTDGHPGLAFDLDGRGCNELAGEFSVSNLYDEPIDGLPATVHASFVQHCEYMDPALKGDIQFETTFQNGPLVADVLRVNGFDVETAWPLT